MTNSRKTTENMAECRENLQACTTEMKQTRKIDVISRGKVIARIVAGGNPQQDARERLLAARTRCRVGDVLGPNGAEWNKQR